MTTTPIRAPISKPVSFFQINLFSNSFSYKHNQQSGLFLFDDRRRVSARQHSHVHGLHVSIRPNAKRLQKRNKRNSRRKQSKNFLKNQLFNFWNQGRKKKQNKFERKSEFESDNSAAIRVADDDADFAAADVSQPDAAFSDVDADDCRTRRFAALWSQFYGTWSFPNGNFIHFRQIKAPPLTFRKMVIFSKSLNFSKKNCRPKNFIFLRILVPLFVDLGSENAHFEGNGLRG